MTQKRNICLINDSFPPVIDGVSNTVANYASIITREYGSAAVVTPYYPDTNDAAFPFPILRYPSVDLTRLVGYRAGLPFSAELMGKLEAGHFDLIHSHCPFISTLLARLLRDRLRAPLILTYHTKFDIDIAHAVHNKYLQGAAIRLLVQNISSCDEVWTVSHGAGENLRSLGYKGEYVVMPNGVDLPMGRAPEEQVQAVGRDYDLPPDVPVFLFLGRMMWYKGLRIILDALKEIKDGGMDFRMIFVGKGADKPEVETYAQELALGDKVFFAPPAYERDTVRAWYCRADLFLFPSTYDTNGLVVREAAACGLASVLVAGSCAAEDVTDGRNGLLIEENAAALAAVLRQTQGRLPELREIGTRAQREIYLSWDAAVKMACQRYEEVLENYRRGAYPPREVPGDELFRRMAESMATINRARSHSQNLGRAVVSNFRGFRDDILEERDVLYEKLDELRQHWNRP